MTRVQRCILIGLLLATMMPGRVHASEAPVVYFEQSGHHISAEYGFLRFWRAGGQVTTFGFPITEPFLEAGRPVQYFERARFEYDAASDSVLLGLLGREILAEAESPVAASPPGRYFPETGHTLDGEFLDYWERHGGLPIFGYPLTEARDEGGLLVQWFERVRLEYHPEAMRPLWSRYEKDRGLDLDPLYEIIPSDLGRTVAAQRGLNTAAFPRLPGAPDWSPRLWVQSIRVSLSRYTLEAFEGDLLVLSTPIAIGKPGFETVTGTFRIGQKWWEKDMRSSERGESWDTKAVPFTQFFYRDWAIHGTYWHDDFGSRRSHGCVNLPLEAAEWLYAWTQAAPEGTLVVVLP